DPFLQDAVGWQPYCVFDPLCFEELVDIGIGEPRVGPEINARDLPLVAFQTLTARCARTKSAIGVILQELPRRIHEWMPRLAEEGVVGADAIFACLGPALEIFSRYSRVEKASGETVSLKEYLEQVWAA